MLLSLLLLPGVFGLFNLGTLQSVAVKGRVTCNEEPMKNVKLKLYEVENVLDELMDERYSDANGTFYLQGKATEVTSIDPKLNIYHRCKYDGFCYKKLEIEIPESFVSEGETVSKTFDVGELNLAGAYSGEVIDCIN